MRADVNDLSGRAVTLRADSNERNHESSLVHSTDLSQLLPSLSGESFPFFPLHKDNICSVSHSFEIDYLFDQTYEYHLREIGLEALL